MFSLSNVFGLFPIRSSSDFLKETYQHAPDEGWKGSNRNVNIITTKRGKKDRV